MQKQKQKFKSEWKSQQKCCVTQQYNVLHELTTLYTYLESVYASLFVCTLLVALLAEQIPFYSPSVTKLFLLRIIRMNNNE